jgi:hypothetical protein
MKWCAPMTLRTGRSATGRCSPAPVTRPASATSFYDTSALRETLLELVDFELINGRSMHFSVGAVNALSGNFVYFDNIREVILPEQ